MGYICLQVLGHAGVRLALSFSSLPQASCCTEDGFCFIFLFKRKYLMGKRENVAGDAMLWQGTAARLSLPRGSLHLPSALLFGGPKSPRGAS